MLLHTSKLIYWYDTSSTLKGIIQVILSILPLIGQLNFALLSEKSAKAKERERLLIGKQRLDDDYSYHIS